MERNGTSIMGLPGSNACIFENTPRLSGWISVNKTDE
jgi:hypothetical protein